MYQKNHKYQVMRHWKSSISGEIYLAHFLLTFFKLIFGKNLTGSRRCVYTLFYLND